MTQFDNAYSQYYDLLYSDKSYHAEAEYVVRLLKRFGVVSGRILEFGSGTGKHGKLLADCGYNLHGIEISEWMLERASTIKGVTFEKGDIRYIQLGQTFDVVLSLFHVISYQTSNDDLLDVFSRANEHLLAGGLFVFDFWYSPAVLTQGPSVRVKKVTNDHIDVLRVAEPEVRPNQNLVDVVYTVNVSHRNSGVTERFEERHLLRHLSLPEIKFLADVTGFDLLHHEEFMSGEALSANSWCGIVVLRKKNL